MSCETDRRLHEIDRQVLEHQQWIKINRRHDSEGVHERESWIDELLSERNQIITDRLGIPA